MAIQIQKVGDWERFGARMLAAAQAANKKGEEAVEQLANDSRAYIVQGIERQWFTMRKLHPRYVAYKSRQGFDERILIKTHKYLDSIKVIKDEKGFRLGVDPYAKADNGKFYEQIATELEYGTSKTPGRPHWRPTEVWAKLQADLRGLKILDGIIGVRKQ